MQNSELYKRIEKLTHALQTIMTWDKQTFPKVQDLHDPTKFWNYGFAYGSNGERDYMRSIAAEAMDVPYPASWRMGTINGKEEKASRSRVVAGRSQNR